MKISNKNKGIIILNLIFFLIFLFTFGLIIRRNIVVRSTNPICCKIIKIHCKDGRYSSYDCDLIFNSQKYHVSTFHCSKYSLGVNCKDFYYDELLNNVFCDGVIGYKILWIPLLMFIFTLVPWYKQKQ